MKIELIKELDKTGKQWFWVEVDGVKWSNYRVSEADALQDFEGAVLLQKNMFVPSKEVIKTIEI